MKIEIIVTEGGVFIPKGPLYEWVADVEVGRTLRQMATGAPPKKERKKRTRKALGKGIAEGGGKNE